jgi:hypothetical protein
LGGVGCGSNGATHLHLALRFGNPMKYANPRKTPVAYRCARVP